MTDTRRGMQAYLETKAAMRQAAWEQEARGCVTPVMVIVGVVLGTVAAVAAWAVI